MAITRLLLRKIYQTMFVLSKRRLRSEEEDALEVVSMLGRYRSMRSLNEAIVVDSFQPLSETDKKNIREFLQAPEETRMIERVNPGLAGSFQIIYRGSVYSYHNSHHLDQLRESFIYS